MSLVLRATLVAVVAAGVLAVAGCSSPPACAAAAGSCAPNILQWPPFATTINGRTAVSNPSRPGPTPSFRVRSGERLVMQVAVKVRKHWWLTELWLGICKNSYGGGPGHRPTGMNPVLYHSRLRLAAGRHEFGLRWRVSDGGLGASVFLCTAWQGRHSIASVGVIAILNTSPAAS